MQDSAHISFAGGGLILPAHTPYERQLVFEHIEASAKQHQHVALSAAGRHWTINLDAARDEPCAQCFRSMHRLAYRTDGRNVCGRCVRRALM